VDEAAIDRAMRRLAQAELQHDPAEADLIFGRTRARLEELAEAAASLESNLPDQVAAAVREGIRSESLPVARQLAETRGLSGQAIRRLERLQTDLERERRARVDDLALLVELITSGWRGIDERLARIERALAGTGRRIEAA
jgi:hypothetical protein